MVNVRTLRTAAAATILFGAVACNRTPTPGIARGEAVFDTCVPCHGSDGAGNQDLGAPAIAGLPEWYLVNQLQKYQNGQRGANPFDTVGIRMKSMALSLDDVDGDLESVAAYVASMPDVDAIGARMGDVVAGQTAYAICATCHGTDGQGNEALGAPPLQGQHDWYVRRQLWKFRNGLRGVVAGDLGGTLMRANAVSLDDAAIENLAAFIATLREAGE